MIPGLLCSPRLYADQVPQLWRLGPVTIADHTRDESMSAIARRILGSAPPRFALVGLSMGGYVSFEILRQAPERVAKLALLDTSARPDTPEQSELRRAQIELAKSVGGLRSRRCVHSPSRSSAAPGQIRECAKSSTKWPPRLESRDSSDSSSRTLAVPIRARGLAQYAVPRWCW